MALTAGQVLKIALLPRIIPRTKTLLSGGFGYVSFYTAQIFRSAGLLPAGHPYLIPANFGRYGLSHVTLEAWHTMIHGRRHIDQMIIFALVLIGIVILFMQFCFLGFALFAQAAHAGLPAGGFLNTANPTDDIAFILLDSIFGLPDFFGSCVEQSIDCFDYPENPYPHPAAPYPLPYHQALRVMLEIYSTGLLVIAMIMFMYFGATVFLETAESGTPFGKRFNHVWAPVRMVIAIALLIPVANGFNAAQYLVMYAAKWGSGFATNGWTLFVADATGTGETILGDPKDLIAIPNSPPVNTLLEFATVVAACRVAEASGSNPREVKPYVIFPDLVGPAARADFLGLTFAQALDNGRFGDIHLVFGVYEEKAGVPVHTSYAGQVNPVCGELVLQITDVDNVLSAGSYSILSGYYTILQMMFLYDIFDPVPSNYGGGSMSMRTIGYAYVRRNMEDVRMQLGDYPGARDPAYPLPESEDLANIREFFISEVDALITAGIASQATSPLWTTMTDFGWAGAGIWYNNVARMNGSLLGAAYAMPVPMKYPQMMEHARKERLKYNESGTGPERFNPEISGQKKAEYDPPKGYLMAVAMYQAQKVWTDAYSSTPTAGMNPFLDSIDTIFGEEALFELSKNTNVHPLAGLVALGKALVETSIRNLGASGAAGVAGGFANLFKNIQPLGKIGTAVADFAKQIGMMGLSMGFLLFYVLPFMPFLYFFFAVGGWVKGIFESVVAVPLWALAHIRIDGNSLPGDAARGGYFMLFEIFLRPILIIFAMLGSITIFAAQVKVLNEIWPLVASNVTGYNASTGKMLPPDQTGSLEYYRGVADRFFYTVVYAIVVYMMGTSSFKMIDQLPAQIMRWIGTDVTSFMDQNKEGPDGLMVKMKVGANMVGGQLGNVLSEGKTAIDKAGAAAGQMAKR